MAITGDSDVLAQQSSRRAVLRTGAKLAYAAPLVAATMKLTDSAAAISGGPCPPCYILDANGRCVRTQDPMNGDCPCGFEPSTEDFFLGLGYCVKDGCADCFQNVGGICVPEAPGTAPNGPCDCGFQDVGGICVPRYPS
jgi:hypothetical protein